MYIVEGWDSPRERRRRESARGSRKCATQLDGLRVITVGGKTVTRDFHVFKSKPNWAVNPRSWGEAGVLTDGPDGKTGDRGIEMIDQF